MAIPIEVNVIPHDLAAVVDPQGHCAEYGVVVGHVERGDSALPPEEAMSLLVDVPVGAHELPLRVETARL